MRRRRRPGAWAAAFPRPSPHDTENLPRYTENPSSDRKSLVAVKISRHLPPAAGVSLSGSLPPSPSCADSRHCTCGRARWRRAARRPGRSPAATAPPAPPPPPRRQGRSRGVARDVRARRAVAGSVHVAAVCWFGRDASRGCDGGDGCKRGRSGGRKTRAGKVAGIGEEGRRHLVLASRDLGFGQGEGKLIGACGVAQHHQPGEGLLLSADSMRAWSPPMQVSAVELVAGQ